MRDRGWSAQKMTTPVDRQQDQRREQARDVEPVLRFEQAEGEAGAGAGRAGGEFGDDGGDQREAAADPEAGEEIGQRAGIFRRSSVCQRLAP